LKKLKEKRKEQKMPAKSKKQAGFMGLILSGKKKVKGLSKKKAKEFLKGVKVSKLPKKTAKKK
jgi:hypothetical protein